MIICYTVRGIWYMTDVICIFHFGLFFAPKNQNEKKKRKKKKTAWRYYHFTRGPKDMTKTYDHTMNDY